MVKIIDIMAKIQALHSSAKRYHWQCTGPLFNGDHLLFDRVAETFDNDDIDELAETWYMADGRYEITNLNDFDKVVMENVCYEFNKEDLARKDANSLMFSKLRDKIKEILPLLEDETHGLAISSILANLSSKYTQILGLIDARLAKETDIKVLNRLRLK